MEARKKKFEELDISRDEINNIGKALQNEEFRKLFADYCQEVTSPQNKELFQQEITELEKQRGVDVTFINPEPGFVVKTSVDGHQKAFINICKNENVSKPSSTPSSQQGTTGRQWSLPFSLAPPREDLDKQRNRCSVFDVVFHPEALQSAEKSQDFRRMLIETALDAVESNCHVTLDKTNLKFPKMIYKGLQQAAVVRKKIPNHKTSQNDQEFLDSIPYPLEDNAWGAIQKQRDAPMKEKTKSTSVNTTVPRYIIKYRHGVDMGDFTNDATSKLNATVPKELVIEIDLPLLKSTNDVKLDVTHNSLALLSEKPNYKLDIVLPYGVDEDAGRATFDTSCRKLSLVLPVKRCTPSLSDGGREDSGVESDLGARPDEESDDKTPSENSDEGSEGSDVIHPQELPCSQEDTSYRTIPLIKPDSDEIEESSINYSLPNFTCNAFENMIAFTVHVKNVEEKSVNHRIVMGSQGMQFSFSSLGGGLFPQHYGLCILFPSGTSLEEESIGFEVWDNNVVIQVQLRSPQPLSELLVGTGLHDLQVQDFPSLAMIEKKLCDLQISSNISQALPPAVNVLSAKPEEMILTVQPETQNKRDEEQTGGATNPPSTESKAERNTEEQLKKKSSISAERSLRKLNVRQLSECSSDVINGLQIRGILKKRPVRSLSESNAEEYAWLHRSISDDGESAGLSSALGSELCVADEGSEAGCETENDSGDRQTKKTVRFNDVIAKQTFRPNSSILGQRKKNQRKQRNKKRAQERRASESENSDPEAETAKAGRRNSLQNDPPEGKYCKNKFMKDSHCIQPDTIAAKKILRKVPSSDTDEDASRDNKNGEVNHFDSNDGHHETLNTAPESSLAHSLGDSSEDERDIKTEEKKKKKKGKKNNSKGSNKSHETSSTVIQPQFDSALMLDIEI